MNAYKIYISYFDSDPFFTPEEMWDTDVIYAETDVDATLRSRNIKEEYEEVYGKHGEVKIKSIWRKIA